MTPNSLSLSILITISSIAAFEGAHIKIFFTDAFTSMVMMPWIV
jgi:hypothetical protein